MNTRAKTGGKPTKSFNKNTSVNETSIDSVSDSYDMGDSPNSRGTQHVTSDNATPEAPSMSDIATLITSLKASSEANSKLVNTKLDTVIGDIASLKVEFAGIKHSVSELEAFASVASERLDDIEHSSLPEMLKKIEKVRDDLEEKLILFEIHERKLNLLVYGTRMSPNENVYKECFAVFASVLNISPEEAMRTIPLTNAHRLPRRKPSTSYGAGDSQQPDPIIVRFGRMQDRDRVLFASQQRQRPTRGPAQSADSTPKIVLRTDLPAVMKRERGRLASIAYHLRKERRDISTRIIVNGTRVILQTRTAGNLNGPPSAWSAWKETPQ